MTDPAPRVGPVVGWRVALAVAVAVPVVVAAGSRARPVAAVLVVAVVATWALDLMACADPRLSPDVRRQAPEVATHGDEITVTWVLTNPGSRRLHVELVDAVPPALGVVPRRIDVEVGATATVTATASGVAQRRGRHRWEEVAVRTWGPLGFAGRQTRRRLATEVRVLPSALSRRMALARIDATRLLDVGARSVRGRGVGQFESLRDYRPGDELRHLDWAGSARRGHPVVRTFRAERDQPVVLLVDAGRTMAANVGGVPRLDWAIDAAVAVAAVVERVGDRLALVAYDASVRRVVPPRRAGGPAALLDAMSDLEPSLVESDHRRAFNETMHRFGRRSLMLVLTELTPGSVEETLVPALPVVTSRHLVTVAAVRDPDTDRWLSSEPGTVDDVHRQAAVAGSQRRRHQMAARLGAGGATVIDVVADRLADRLIEQYLDTKRVGAL